MALILVSKYKSISPSYHLALYYIKSIKNLISVEIAKKGGSQLN